MMRIAILIVLLSASAAFAQTPKVIKVTAERFAYTPSEIVVEKGTTIEFHLTSDDTDHGFRIVGTDVNAEIPKRRRGETVVKYVADTAGTFIIECSRPCGAGRSTNSPAPLKPAPSDPRKTAS